MYWEEHMATETAHRKRQRLWRNEWLEQLARQIEAKARNFPNSEAHFNAAAQVVREEKRLTPGVLTPAEEAAQAVGSRRTGVKL